MNFLSTLRISCQESKSTVSVMPVFIYMPTTIESDKRGLPDGELGQLKGWSSSWLNRRREKLRQRLLGLPRLRQMLKLRRLRPKQELMQPRLREKLPLRRLRRTEPLLRNWQMRLRLRLMLRLTRMSLLLRKLLMMPKKLRLKPLLWPNKLSKLVP